MPPPHNLLKIYLQYTQLNAVDRVNFPIILSIYIIIISKYIIQTSVCSLKYTNACSIITMFEVYRNIYYQHSFPLYWIYNNFFFIFLSMKKKHTFATYNMYVYNVGKSINIAFAIIYKEEKEKKNIERNVEGRTINFIVFFLIIWLKFYRFLPLFNIDNREY